MKRYQITTCLCLFAFLCLLVSCAHQPLPDAYDPPGFFMGIWHGMIAPFAFVWSLLSDVRIYAFPNSGGWYDFGFLIGVGAWCGGAAASK